jgi:hypothetical protein
MKKAFCIVAFAAIFFGSVYAAPVQKKDTVKVGMKSKTGKLTVRKKTVKVKDTTAKKM